jgi:hypothetical protein
MQCSGTSLVCQHQGATTCRADQQCVGNACQCDGSTVACKDGSSTCGAWNFEAGGVEGWYFTIASVNASLSVQSHGGSKQLAITLYPDPNLGGNAAGFTISKDLCSPMNGIDPANRNVSYTTEIVPPPDLSQTDASAFVLLENLVQYQAGPDGSLASEPYTFQSGPISPPLDNQHATRLDVGVQVRDFPPGASSVTVYIDNIAIQ